MRAYSKDAPTWEDVGQEWQSNGETWKIGLPKGRGGLFTGVREDGHCQKLDPWVLVRDCYMAPAPTPHSISFPELHSNWKTPQWRVGHYGEYLSPRGARAMYVQAGRDIKASRPLYPSTNTPTVVEMVIGTIAIQTVVGFSLCDVPEGNFFWMVVPDES